MGMRTEFRSENLKGRDHVENPGADENVTGKWIVRKQTGKLQTGFIWLRIGTSGGLLSIL
jgi:hypothetical protein